MQINAFDLEQLLKTLENIHQQTNIAACINRSTTTVSAECIPAVQSTLNNTLAEINADAAAGIKLIRSTMSHARGCTPAKTVLLN